MKNIFTPILLLFTVYLTATAQETASKDILVDNFAAETSVDKLHIGFTVHATELEIRRNDQLKLEFAVESGNRRLRLPAVVYSGKQRYRFERRRNHLSDTYRIEPYYVYRGVDKNRTYALEYRLSIPYYAWMEHASVTYQEYRHCCSGDVPAKYGVLAADLSAASAAAVPKIWTPDSALLPALVMFIEPQVEEVKARASELLLYVGFPVNVTEVRPGFGDNHRELARADSLISALRLNALTTITAVSIRGYASPEGGYATNERLARGRSEQFKRYLAGRHPDSDRISNARISWVAEDWDGLGRLIEANATISRKDEILAIVYNDNILPDDKYRMLQNIEWWSHNYRTVVLREMFPKLRRIVLRVDYTISALTDSQARELLYTDPGMLSLDEIFRVARHYDPGTRQYREAYETAARLYPDDIVANNNAAAAVLRDGDAEAAKVYLDKIGDRPEALVNRGVYHYVKGDLERALEYFAEADKAGIEQGTRNLELTTPGRSR